jgi:hypothetical protein
MTPQPHTTGPRAQPLDRASVRETPREDARWYRPVFRPPPLDVEPRPEFSDLGTSYVGFVQRTELSAPAPAKTPAK